MSHTDTHNGSHEQGKNITRSPDLKRSFFCTLRCLGHDDFDTSWAPNHRDIVDDLRAQQAHVIPWRQHKHHDKEPVALRGVRQPRTEAQMDAPTEAQIVHN